MTGPSSSALGAVEYSASFTRCERTEQPYSFHSQASKSGTRLEKPMSKRTIPLWACAIAALPLLACTPGGKHVKPDAGPPANDAGPPVPVPSPVHDAAPEPSPQDAGPIVADDAAVADAAAADGGLPVPPDDEDAGSDHSGLTLVRGAIRSVGASASLDGVLELRNQGFEFLAPQCVSTQGVELCVTGSIQP
jgi:hypothetical protein